MGNMLYDHFRKIISFQKPEKISTIRNLSCNSEYEDFIIKLTNWNEISIGHMQTLNNKVSLPKSNIKLPENEIMTIYLRDGYSLLQIKEKSSCN